MTQFIRISVMQDLPGIRINDNVGIGGGTVNHSTAVMVRRMMFLAVMLFCHSRMGGGHDS